MGTGGGLAPAGAPALLLDSAAPPAGPAFPRGAPPLAPALTLTAGPTEAPVVPPPLRSADPAAPRESADAAGRAPAASIFKAAATAAAARAESPAVFDGRLGAAEILGPDPTGTAAAAPLGAEDATEGTDADAGAALARGVETLLAAFSCPFPCHGGTVGVTPTGGGTWGSFCCFEETVPLVPAVCCCARAAGTAAATAAAAEAATAAIVLAADCTGAREDGAAEGWRSVPGRTAGVTGAAAASAPGGDDAGGAPPPTPPLPDACSSGAAVAGGCSEGCDAAARAFTASPLSAADAPASTAVEGASPDVEPCGGVEVAT